MFLFLSHSPEETEKFAARFSKKLEKGDALSLCGELGGGKTTFVRGLFEGMGGHSKYLVTSPTFTLFHEYPTKKGPLYHMDLYRLENYRDLENADLVAYFDKGGIVALEWGDKFPELMSLCTYQVFFEMTGESERRIVVKKLDRK